MWHCVSFASDFGSSALQRFCISALLHLSVSVSNRVSRAPFCEDPFLEWTAGLEQAERTAEKDLSIDCVQHTTVHKANWANWGGCWYLQKESVRGAERGRAQRLSSVARTKLEQAAWNENCLGEEGVLCGVPRRRNNARPGYGLVSGDSRWPKPPRASRAVFGQDARFPK